MQHIYAYKEYGNTKRYAQTVSSNHPIPPTSKTHGRWKVYNRIQNNNTTYHTKKIDMYISHKHIDQNQSTKGDTYLTKKRNMIS